MNRNLMYILLMAILSLTFTLTTKTANAYIIDIDAQVYGSSGNAVDVFLDAGTYSVVPIGVEDGGAYNGWNAWGRTSPNIGPDGIPWPSVDAYGWLNKYKVYSPNLTTAFLGGIPVDLSGGLSYSGWDHMLYSESMDALNHSLPSTFTVSNGGLVSFYVGDSPIYDNIGGMSLALNLVLTNENPVVPTDENP
ncbi:MAG: hypothetical protein ACYSTS_18335, partial [Planctomycetota bacterium]